jgi:hypothetical protein
LSTDFFESQCNHEASSQYRLRRTSLSLCKIFCNYKNYSNRNSLNNYISYDNTANNNVHVRISLQNLGPHRLCYFRLILVFIWSRHSSVGIGNRLLARRQTKRDLISGKSSRFSCPPWSRKRIRGLTNFLTNVYRNFSTWR